MPIHVHNSWARMTGWNDNEFLTELPPIPEDEFCVYGTVNPATLSCLFRSRPDNVHLQVYAHPEHTDALEAVYAETTRLAGSESGTIYYCLGRDPGDPNVFHFFERYKGKAAFAAHNDQPVIKKLLADNLIKGVKARFTKPIDPAGQP